MPDLQPMPVTSLNAITKDFDTKLSRQLTTKRVLVVGGSVVAVAAALPVVIMAVQAGLALFAFGGLVVVGLTAKKMFPLWMYKVENRIREANQAEKNRTLVAMKQEAKTNPIEQAQNEYFRRSKQYEVFKEAMVAIGGKVKSFKSKLDATRKAKPKYDLSQEEAAYDKMKQFYDSRVTRLEDAHVKLGLFKEKIDEANTKWEFQLDANAAIRAMNATDQEAKMAEIMTEVAFDSVQQEFDSVFARLDVDAAELSANKTLDFDGGSLDVSTIKIGDTNG